MTISTTLISYLLIYPALWKLRRSHPATPRPVRMPAHRVLTVALMVLVAVATVQLIAPGLGSSWFGSDFIPSGWTYAQRFSYLWTKLIPGAGLRRDRGAVLVAGAPDPGRGTEEP